jgi:hypothetical protein
MRPPTKVRYQIPTRNLRSDTFSLLDEMVGRILVGIAVLLVGAIILVAEYRLPEEMRFGLFEAMYTSP